MTDLMSIHRAERWAKDHDEYDKGEFIAFFPNGPKNCRWLDAYMGLFRVHGIEGFLTVKTAEDEWPDLLVIPLECSTGLWS